MSATLAAAPEAVAGRSTFVNLALRELRRFVVNPVFLFGVGMTAWIVADPEPGVVEIDSVAGYPAVFLGGLGMMAMYWLTRSMRDSEPVVGVTPTTRPVRTAALCAVAFVPFSERGRTWALLLAGLFPLLLRLAGRLSEALVPLLGGHVPRHSRIAVARYYNNAAGCITPAVPAPGSAMPSSNAYGAACSRSRSEDAPYRAAAETIADRRSSCRGFTGSGPSWSCR